MFNTEPQEGVKPQPPRRAMRRKTQLTLTVAAEAAQMPQNAGQANGFFFSTIYLTSQIFGRQALH